MKSFFDDIDDVFNTENIVNDTISELSTLCFIESLNTKLSSYFINYNPDKNYLPTYIGKLENDISFKNIISNIDCQHILMTLLTKYEKEIMDLVLSINLYSSLKELKDAIIYSLVNFENIIFDTYPYVCYILFIYCDNKDIPTYFVNKSEYTCCMDLN